MALPIEFYFDLSSPYGYIASTRIEDIAARHNRSVLWKPILLGATFRIMGSQPLVDIPLKGEYSRRDFSRTARFYGVPFNMPTSFPIATVAAARAVYWAADRQPQEAKALARALFHAYFVDDRDISPSETVLAIVAEQGLDRAACQQTIEDPAHKERVKQEVERAVAKGVFGSPYIVVDGEPFWGSDRLDQVDRWLATGGW